MRHSQELGQYFFNLFSYFKLQTQQIFNVFLTNSKLRFSHQNTVFNFLNFQVEIEKQLVNLQKTTANQEKEIQDLLFIKRSNEIQLLESEQQVSKIKQQMEYKKLKKSF